MDELTDGLWRRCSGPRVYGLDPGLRPTQSSSPAADLRERQERARRLLEIARPEMTNLYQQLAGSGHAIMLTDRDGVLLNYIGDPIFTDTAAQVGIQTGAVWSEAVQGTNGMGTCLIEKKPLVIHKVRHFFERNAGLTCAAAPIFDPNGNVLAILDASSEATLAQQHTMVLLNMSAQVVENRVFFCAMSDAYIFRCHSRAEFIGTLGEGLIAFTPDGRILAVNRSAIFQLETERAGTDRRARDPRPLHHLAPHAAQARPLPERRRLPHPRDPLRAAFLRQGPGPREQRPPRAGAGACRPHLVGEARSTPAVIGPFEALHFGDPRMQRNVATVKKVLDRDIPCMLLGETGVGKDVFARAIHQASPRRDKPFVALNCASLPESLIESELFGYKAGRLHRRQPRGQPRQDRPGRRRHPVPRRDRRHAGATPGPAAARPGGPHGRPLGRRQTHPRLHPAHQRHPPGRARTDRRRASSARTSTTASTASRLTIPPLRERTDRRELILKIAQEQAGAGVTLEWEPAALERLVNYPWPGNLRQLRNVMRAVTALCDDNRITLRRPARRDPPPSPRTAEAPTPRKRNSTRWGSPNATPCCGCWKACTGTSAWWPRTWGSAAIRCIGG